MYVLPGEVIFEAAGFEPDVDGEWSGLFYQFCGADIEPRRYAFYFVIFGDRQYLGTPNPLFCSYYLPSPTLPSGSSFMSLIVPDTCCLRSLTMPPPESMLRTSSL